jgi:DnaJ-class molecular chaperone
MKVPVTLDEAYSGANVEVPTFQGQVQLRIPPLSQNGARLRLRGKGIERSGKKGDLFVELELRLPDAKDDALAAALEKAKASYTSSPRKDLRL